MPDSSADFEAKSCTSKTAFASQMQAHDAMIQFANSSGTPPRHLNTYKCGFCNKFHFGHKLRFRGDRL